MFEQNSAESSQNRNSVWMRNITGKVQEVILYFTVYRGKNSKRKKQQEEKTARERCAGMEKIMIVSALPRTEADRLHILLFFPAFFFLSLIFLPMFRKRICSLKNSNE
jgi:hypothetical protein